MIKKLENFGWPWNITKIIKSMLESFTLQYNSRIIKTSKGLVQGLVLSLLLFNIFLNDLMILFKIEGIFVRAYADDIVCIWNSQNKNIKAINIMREWQLRNSMKINPEKSGIMKVLLKKGKWKGIKNSLNIPEVDTYKYLGIKIKQSLQYKEHENMLKNTEVDLRRKLAMLNTNLIDTRSKMIIFNTIIKTKFSYGAAIIWKYNSKYSEKWQGLLYKSLKTLFGIKINVSKSKLFKILEIELFKSTIEKYLKNETNAEKFNDKFIYNLNNKAIKIKLECSFTSKGKERLWKWTETVNNDNVMKRWYKTKEWRFKWDKISKELCNLTIDEMIAKSPIKNTDHNKTALLINQASEELFIAYFNSD